MTIYDLRNEVAPVIKLVPNIMDHATPKTECEIASWGLSFV